MRRVTGLAAALCLLVLAGCSSSDGDTAAPRMGTTTTPEGSDSSGGGSTGVPGHTGHARPSKPLRAHERFVDVAMPEPYAPEAPTYGTDDYRCFLLDPHLNSSAFVTGVNVLPGRPDIVHHVILFQVPPSDVPEAEAKDAEEPEEGWTCFGGTGLDG